MICPLASFISTTSSVVSSQDALGLGIAEPYCQSLAYLIMDYFDFVHTVSPALIASVGYAVTKKPEPSSSFATAQSHLGFVPL